METCILSLYCYSVHCFVRSDGWVWRLTGEVRVVSLDRAKPDPSGVAAAPSRSSGLLLRLALQHHSVHGSHRDLQPLLLLLLLLLLQLPRTLEVEAEKLFQVSVHPLFSGHVGAGGGLVSIAVLALLDAGRHAAAAAKTTQQDGVRSAEGRKMGTDGTD